MKSPPASTPRPIIWTNPALADLAAIRTYIEAMNPPAAARVAQQIVDAADTLETFPMRGRPWRGARVLVAVPPYLIRYRVQPDAVLILGVRHRARRP